MEKTNGIDMKVTGDKLVITIAIYSSMPDPRRRARGSMTHQRRGGPSSCSCRCCLDLRGSC
jgi:hypothetical protein